MYDPILTIVIKSMCLSNRYLLFIVRVFVGITDYKQLSKKHL